MSGPAHAEILSTASLSKSFDGRALWTDLDLEFAPGTMTSLVGPSGCGKTTLLNCLGLLEAPTSGSIEYGGQQLSLSNRRRLYRETFGFLFQNNGLVDQDSVRSNLCMSPTVGRMSRKDRALTISSALDRVGLAGRESDPVFRLSGGEQQRVALARLILHDSRVIFVDEPTASLDEANSFHVIDVLRGIAAAGGTVIAATHDPLFVQECDRTVSVGPAVST